MLRSLYFVIFASFLSLVSGFAMATGTDYSAVTAALDFTTAITAVLGLGALIAAVLGTIKGVKLLWKLL